MLALTLTLTLSLTRSLTLAKVVLGDTALEAFVAQFSGPLPTRPQEWQLAPVVPADGCGALVLDPAWVAALGAARLPSLPTGLLLLLRRGGCSFTEKASRALALAANRTALGRLSARLRSDRPGASL